MLGALVFADTAATQLGGGGCPNGQQPTTVEVGIVKAIGCWTQSNQNGATVYTAAWQDQGDGVDLNGFVVSGPTGGGLQINASTNRVTSVALTQGPGNDQAQLKSRNWPISGQLSNLGSPIKLDFVAPQNSALLLEDLTFGSNTVARALGGLSPVGTVETPVRLEPGGTGSMDLTVALAGAFTLKGKPQSVTISLPTISGQGTKLDGFEIKLEEIDTFKVITINNFDAKYSASENVIAGSATATFPFSQPGMQGVGFGLGFKLEQGALTEVNADAHGLHIPIGEPPGGFVTDIGGGFRLQNREGGFDILIMANLTAELGPEIPLPWGKVAPIEVDAGLQLGNKNNQLFFQITGGVKVFRLSVGDVYLAIYFNSGVQFGVGLGIGFPSYQNNPNDPFYIGARVDGWIAKGKFQFEGSGRVALFGARIFDGQILVNDRAAGACWKVLWVPGGAVYVYGSSGIKTFGVGCGLDDYKEQFPGSASATAGRPRKIRLSDEEVILAVKGAGAAPRFTMRSAKGQVLTAPVDADSKVEHQGFRHAFFVNEYTQTTHVLLPHPKGVWTIIPNADSVPVISAKAGRMAPKEKVKAEIRGKGRVRTLVWDSLGRPHTRLVFTELLPGGLEIPILETGKAKGRKRFRVAPGSHYGKRRLRVVVIHGYGSRQRGVADAYHVSPPRKLHGPEHVSAWRQDHDVYVKWSGVKGAHGYLIEVAMKKDGQRVSNYVRRASAGARRIVIRHHPGGGRAVAKVFALNSDDKLGRNSKHRFRTNPTAHNLRQAAQRSARSATRHGGGAGLLLRCPPQGHCQTVVKLRYRGRVVRTARLQQIPHTFHLLRIAPKSGSLRRALAKGDPKAQVVVELSRTDEKASAKAIVKG